MENLSIFDTIYTLITFILNIGFVALIVIFIRKIIDNNKRIKRIENMLEELSYKIENNK